MWNEEKLNELLTTPTQRLIDDIKKIKGDIMVLGAAGKMGPSLCVLAKKACQAAGIDKRIIGVARMSDPIAVKYMEENGVELIKADLLDLDQLNALPFCENVIYMAGLKFGTNGNEWKTWAMNATLPAFVANKYKKANIVVFSSGNIYNLVPVVEGGCKETDKPVALNEYAQSVLARERAFEFASNTFGTNVFMYRLDFAIDLRYGVLYDCANKVMNGTPISLTTPCVNVIWQGSANEYAIRALLHTSSPATVMNITGPECISVRAVCKEFGELLGKEPVFENEPGTDAYIEDSTLAMETFGYPSVPLKTMVRWQAEWILEGGRALNKPTHFEERGGKY